MQPILSAHQVNFKNILFYPDIQIAPGRATFVCGPSGCGKSTLLRLWNATQSPAGGRLCYAGRDIETLDTLWLRRRVLLAAQMAYLFEGTVRHSFAEYFDYRALPAPKDAEMRRYLGLCQGDFSLDADCGALSGGEKQRVYLAICLALLCVPEEAPEESPPRVLLLDEPTGALDGDTASALLASLLGYCAQEEITPVVVSHDAALVRRFAANVVTLEGRPSHAKHRGT